MTAPKPEPEAPRCATYRTPPIREDAYVHVFYEGKLTRMQVCDPRIRRQPPSPPQTPPNGPVFS